MKQIDDHRWEVTEPTPIKIGRPATPPPPEALRAMKEAAADSGATTVYWFWVSIKGDPPHLGLAVRPADNEVVSRIGRAIEPIWRHYSPDNSLFDILRLGDPSFDATIREQGELLHNADEDA